MPIYHKPLNDKQWKIYVVYERPSDFYAAEDEFWKHFQWDELQQLIDDQGLRGCVHGNDHFGGISLLDDMRHKLGDIMLIVCISL